MNHFVESVLLHKPYLRLVDGDMYGISQRIKEIEPDYFIVFNSRSHKYEVHSTANRGHNTYCFTVPYDRLDIRTIQHCRETNIAMRGDKIMEEMERDNARLDRENERDFRRNMEDASVETADMVSFGIDQDELHEGYKKTHYMGEAVKNES